MLRIDTRRDDFRAALADLRARLSPQGNVVSEAGRRKTIEVFGEALSPAQVVTRICDDVRSKGVVAVLDYSARIDGVRLTGESLRVPDHELAAAHAQASPDFLAAVRRVRQNVLDFQRAILHRDVRLDRPHGGYLRQRYLPLARVGICVPGGAAAYPSTVLMTAVPAQAAGVEQIAIVAPPTKFGAYNRELLATCHELGIGEVYRLGGAQGVAALAYGVDGLPRVDKIVGPGNLFVALAKKSVYGDVDIDSIAGPSEVVVIADHSTRADYTAADLIAQAEHAPGASILITWSAEVLEATAAELAQQLAGLARGELARQCLEEFGALVLCRDADEACALTDEIAPEHLHIATQDAERLLEKVRHAGAVFLGDHTPVAVGDYVAGPSHVLPTGGTARWASGLCANDFFRRTSVIHCTPEWLADLVPDVCTLAEAEGLTAHRESVAIRVDSGQFSSLDLGFSIANPKFKIQNPKSSSFRPAIDAMSGYVPGEQPQAGKFIKLNTNENPYPASAAVKRAVAAVIEQGLGRYPDPMAGAFRRRAAEVLGVEPEWILCGNGSDELLTIVTRAFVGEGQLLRLPYPSYILYKTLAEIQGAKSEEVCFNDDWSLPNAFASSSSQLRLAFLPNPNSPSGTIIPPERVLELAERLPCPLLVDEAYVDFADVNCLALVKRCEKIMVSRSLSKSYGLAGLRFGFLVAQPHVIEGLIKVKDSYNCDALSIAAATAAIDDQSWLAESRSKIIATRRRLTAGMRELGFEPVESQANFVWCPHSTLPVKPLYERLKANRVLVRYMDYAGWGDGLRISVGSDEQIDACLTLLKGMV